jgi:hypothetical protein
VAANAVVAEAKGKKAAAKMAESKKEDYSESRNESLIGVVSMTWGSVRLWGLSGKPLKRGFRRAIRGNVCTV